MAVIDAVRQKSKSNSKSSFGKQSDSVIGNYNLKFSKRQNDYYGHSSGSQVYLKYKRHPPTKDFVIVENNQRPVQVLDIVQRNP